MKNNSLQRSTNQFLSIKKMQIVKTELDYTIHLNREILANMESWLSNTENKKLVAFVIISAIIFSLGVKVTFAG